MCRDSLVLPRVSFSPFNQACCCEKYSWSIMDFYMHLQCCASRHFWREFRLSSCTKIIFGCRNRAKFGWILEFLKMMSFSMKLFYFVGLVGFYLYSLNVYGFFLSFLWLRTTVCRYELYLVSMNFFLYCSSHFILFCVFLLFYICLHSFSSVVI